MIPEGLLRELETVAAVKKHIGGWDDRGIPWLNKKELEDIARFVLIRLDSKVVERAGRTNVAGILDYLHRRHAVKVIFSEIPDNQGRRVFGKTVFSSNEIWINSDLLSGEHPAFRLTVAHEIGHWLLHRWKPIRLKRRVGHIQETVDTEGELFPKVDHTETDDSVHRLIEMQANIFASSLVMPRHTIRGTIVAKQKELGIHRNLGMIYLNKDNQSWLDFKTLEGHLQEVYGISKQSLHIRLKALELLKADPP